MGGVLAMADEKCPTCGSSKQNVLLVGCRTWAHDEWHDKDGVVPTNTYIRKFGEENVPLPRDAVVMFELAMPYDNVATIECAVKEDGTVLEVRTPTGSLQIVPSVSNVVNVTATR